MASDLSLRKIRSSRIADVAKVLYFEDINSSQLQLILKIAVLFLNNSENEIRDFGYRLLLKACIRTKNFIPLYDISASLGYTPVMELLAGQDHLPKRETFLETFMEAYRQNFTEGNIFQTEEQHALFDSFAASIKETIAVIAPTSYGKSELIEQLTKSQDQENIAVVVPSKALIAQTRRRILGKLAGEKKRQVIVHHDMKFDQNRPVIAVVTQERLLRIYQKYPLLSFGIIIVDEAHNILSDDRRARLLGSVLLIAKARNSKISIKYLTPFLVSSDSLRLVGETAEIKQIKIDEKLKSEEYIICDLKDNNSINYYDQFLDKFFERDRFLGAGVVDFILENRRRKNIVYLNRPQNIEHLASRLSTGQRNFDLTDDLLKICKEISDYVHPQYRILDCLRKGVAYHHGSVPDVVRGYIENAFRNLSAVGWIITNSTLLEGVNIPADILFVLDPRKGRNSLSTSQFRNLVGRVNRFSEIFNLENGSPELLMPSIYLVNCNYSHASLNLKTYVQKVSKIGKKIDDEINNPMLQNSVLNEQGEAKRIDDFIFIENIEPACNFLPVPKRAITLFGRLCYAHNVYEIDVLAKEGEITNYIEEMMVKSYQIDSAEELMSAINNFFVAHLADVDENKREVANLIRLKNPEARKFYSMFFDWRVNQSNYKLMIGSFISYWKRKLSNFEDTVVYAGKWGTVTREGHSPNYVDLKTMSDYDMINLAIVRIKEEQDFLDNNLVKYLEVLNDLFLVNSTLYNKVKYGTDDEQKIMLIRSGFTHIGANVLVEKYKKHLSFSSNGEVKISNRIRDDFPRKQEKELIIFEIESSGLIQE